MQHQLLSINLNLRTSLGLLNQLVDLKYSNCYHDGIYE